MRSSPGSRLLAITKVRAAPLVELVLRSTLPSLLARVDSLLARGAARMDPRVQRMGAQTLSRVLERFPALDTLLQRARKSVEPGADAHQAREATPAPSMETIATPVSVAPSVLELGSLLSALRDVDWRVRADAAQRLGVSQEGVLQEGVEHALLAALRDDSAEVAAAAAIALSQHGGPRASAALREVLESREGFFSPVTRAACVQGLARCLNSDEAQVVLEVIHDMDAEVSIAAILASSERWPELATTRLIALLSEQSSYFLPLVRLAAANALSRLGTLHQDSLSSLLQMETDGDVRRVLEQA